MHSHDESVNLNEAKEAFIKQEGCQLYGYLLVNKVPGNFHISSHAYGAVLGIIMSETGLSSFDLSHTINRLSFGKLDDLEYIAK